MQRYSIKYKLPHAKIFLNIVSNYFLFSVIKVHEYVQFVSRWKTKKKFDSGRRERERERPDKAFTPLKQVLRKDVPACCGCES